MDEPFCFSVAKDNALTIQERVFALMLVFSNNAAEPNGECIGTPFFQTRLAIRIKENVIDIAKVKAFLSKNDIPHLLQHYGGPVTLTPAEIVDSALNKALNIGPHYLRKRTDEAAQLAAWKIYELQSNANADMNSLLTARTEAVKAGVPPHHIESLDMRIMLLKAKIQKAQQQLNQNNKQRNDAVAAARKQPQHQSNKTAKRDEGCAIL
jgi:hypothetical protein